jgi:hypothetical protein
MVCPSEKRKRVGSLRADSRMKRRRGKELKVGSRRPLLACGRRGGSLA